MRLALVLAWCLLPLIATAETRIGLHGGILYNTAPERATTTAVKPYGSFRVYKDVNTVTLAFGLDAGSLDANTTVQFIDSLSGTVEHLAYNHKYAKYFFMPNLSVNIKFPAAKANGYFGANIGYMIGQTSYMVAPTLYSVAKVTEGTSGASVGVHVGFAIPAGDKLSFGLEGAARYTNIGKKRDALFYFPFSAGLMYTL